MIRECLYCKKEFNVYPSQVKKGGGKYCSMSCRATHRNYIDNPAKKEEVRAKISKNHANVSGENNPMYGKRGVLAPSYKDGRKKLGGGYRGKALANFEAKCVECGETNINKLAIHHKDKNRKNNSLLNLEVLCCKCHNTIRHKRERNKKGQFIKG